MKGDQAVLSPEWSIHSAAATHTYTFIWGMGGGFRLLVSHEEEQFAE